MKKLLSLEMQRISLKGHCIGLLAANTIILLLCVFVSVFLNMLEGLPVATMPEIGLDTVSLALMLVRATLTVWQAVFIAKIVVEEYSGKTMGLLYTYPIHRATLIYSKLLLICVIMLGFHLFSSLFQHVAIGLLGNALDFVSFSLQNPGIQLVTIVSTIFLGLVPLCVGMARHSTIATILASIIIVAFSSSSQGNTAGLLSIPLVAMVLGLVGVAVSAVTVLKMVRADL